MIFQSRFHNIENLCKELGSAFMRLCASICLLVREDLRSCQYEPLVSWNIWKCNAVLWFAVDLFSLLLVQYKTTNTKGYRTQSRTELSKTTYSAWKNRNLFSEMINVHWFTRCKNAASQSFLSMTATFEIFVLIQQGAVKCKIEIWLMNGLCWDGFDWWTDSHVGLCFSETWQFFKLQCTNKHVSKWSLHM